MEGVLTSWLILLAAIICEVAGTLTLKFTEGMTRLWPTVLMLAFYVASLFGLSIAVARIPVGTAYAVWSGLGTLMVAAIGIVWFKEQVTLLRCASTLLIVAGVAGLYLTATD
jgi:multidrug transporter EmrE-like cation transporter